jgi:poly(3-hydroxybutyrate) depolymerase
MFYHMYELGHAAMRPARAAADTCRQVLRHPYNPMALTSTGRSAAAACEMMERATRRYRKPSFNISAVDMEGAAVPVTVEAVWQQPFCKLLHFRRARSFAPGGDPRVLIVAPMSGHHATLLRGTVLGMLPEHDVYITDWTDARLVPAKAGRFDLDSYIDYIIEMLHLFGGRVHVMAVCQPSVPVLAAVSRLSAEGDPAVPDSMILMGGPIDTRRSPTAVNDFAQQRGIDWFRRTVIAKVPWGHPGTGRAVYPGFLQLTGFMSMNPGRHMKAHKELYLNLMRGDGDSAAKHTEFYDEYLAVMDLTAEFYLQTIDSVFVQHELPRGLLRHRGLPVNPAAISATALLTIEGEKDDITGQGQCEAAHDLCARLPERMRMHHILRDAGHYGIFNGARFQRGIVPLIRAFIRRHEGKQQQLPGWRRVLRLITGGKASGKEARHPLPLPAVERQRRAA